MENKQLFLYSIIMLLSYACKQQGTLEPLNLNSNDSIEIYKYFYEDGSYVFVSRFKNQPLVHTLTWDKIDKKTVTKCANVVIFENDSLLVMRKK